VQPRVKRKLEAEDSSENWKKCGVVQPRFMGKLELEDL
jgi:hypothetical protein